MTPPEQTPPPPPTSKQPVPVDVDLESAGEVDSVTSDNPLYHPTDDTTN